MLPRGLFSSWDKQGLHISMVYGLLIVAGFVCCEVLALGCVASEVVACRLSSCRSQDLEHRLSSCDASASLLQGMWDLPGSGIESMFPALAGRFLATGMAT